MSSVDNYNDDELEAPTWLNADYFEKFLTRHTGHQHVKVHKVDITPASLKGQHYLSVMFRIKIDYEHGQAGQKTSDKISIIIKTIPEVESGKKALLESSNLFDSEIAVYENVLPEFEKVLQEVGDDTKFAPTCMYTTLRPIKLLVMEDLTPKGYLVLRERQVNLEETKMAYVKLAKFHAVSYKLNSETPRLFENFDASCIADMFYKSQYTRDCIGHFIDILSTKSQYHKYKPYFEEVQKNAFASVHRLYTEYRHCPHAPDDAIYVLNHGDFHGNNVMFQYEETGGALADAKLLDFQGVFVGPIVFDLLYSQYMLLDAQLRANHWDELLELYWRTFLATLRQIDYKGPTPQWATLQRQLREHRYFEMLLFTFNLALYYGFRTGELDAGLILSSAEYCRQVYALPGYLAEVEQLMSRYERMGYFSEHV